MLTNLRNALMAGKRLPCDAEVEYLEGTGTQWIDTDIVSSGFGIRADVVCAQTQSGGEMAIVGRSRGDGFELYSNYNAGKFGLWNRSGNYIELTRQLELSRVYSISAEITTTPTMTLSIDGNVTTKSITSATITDGNILVFKHTSYYFKGRIYSCKIWQNGVLVRDYIPVRKGTVGYLYDRVSGKLFGNAGTGDFVVGPDVVPVEWLGCDGSQYIDTKVVATNSHGFRVDIEAAKKAVDVNTRIFGAHEGNVRCGFALYGEPPSDDYFWGWNEATGFRATIPQRFVVSLNYKNDRAAIFNGTTNLSQLGTLGGMTQSVYLLNANYGNAPFANQFVVGKFYGAEITVGSDVANHYIPVRVGTDATSWEGAMMDVLTRRIYRNAGTGAFTYGNDLKYPIPAS